MKMKFLTSIIFVLVALAGCRLLPSEVPDAEQLGELAEQGKSAAATAQVAAATARVVVVTRAVQASDTATRLAEQGYDVQTAATRAVAFGQEAATRLREDGPSAVATIRSFGTPAVTLAQKLGETRADANGNVFITITEAELTTALTWYKPADGEDMRNIYVQIDDGQFVLFAEVTQPVSGRLGVVFEPIIVDGVFQVRIASASMGGISVPRVVLNSAESRINNTLLAAVSVVPGNVTYTDVTASNGVLTLTGYK